MKAIRKILKLLKNYVKCTQILNGNYFDNFIILIYIKIKILFNNLLK